MMKLTNHQKLLLEELISKYERKQGYGKNDTATKGTIVYVKKFFKNYMHVSDSRYKNDINLEMEELERIGFISLVWEKHNIGEYLEKIYLIEDMLLGIYKALSRVPKIDKYKELSSVVSQFQSNSNKALSQFYDKLLQRLDNLESLPSIVDVDDINTTIDVLNGLNELVKPREQEISKRHWSIQLYKDSKRWETIESRIINVIKRDIFPHYNEIDTSNILSEFGIIENPKAIDIYGNCVMKKSEKLIDFSIDEFGLGCYPTFLRHCDIVSLDVERVVTIENPTSYYDYLHFIQKQDRNELVIYLGGYHNNIRRIILQKLYDYVITHHLNIPFYHWGDIDYGGLTILVHLREKTGIPFKPLFMDYATYLKYLDDGMAIKDNTYLNKIKRLKDNDKYKEFKDLIEAIIEKKVKVEQESITFS